MVLSIDDDGFLLLVLLQILGQATDFVGFGAELLPHFPTPGQKVYASMNRFDNCSENDHDNGQEVDEGNLAYWKLKDFFIHAIEHDEKDMYGDEDQFDANAEVELSQIELSDQLSLSEQVYTQIHQDCEVGEKKQPKTLQTYQKWNGKEQQMVVGICYVNLMNELLITNLFMVLDGCLLELNFIRNLLGHFRRPYVNARRASFVLRFNHDGRLNTFFLWPPQNYSFFHQNRHTNANSNHHYHQKLAHVVNFLGQTAVARGRVHGKHYGQWYKHARRGADYLIAKNIQVLSFCLKQGSQTLKLFDQSTQKSEKGELEYTVEEAKIKLYVVDENLRCKAELGERWPISAGWGNLLAFNIRQAYLTIIQGFLHQRQQGTLLERNSAKLLQLYFVEAQVRFQGQEVVEHNNVPKVEQITDQVGKPNK